MSFADVSLSNIDSRFFAVLGKSGKTAEFAYPQLLGKSAGVKPPSFMSMLMSVVGVFMTEKQKAKFSLCPGPSAERPSASACPYISARMENIAELPSFLGGRCHCTALGGCVGGCPNEQKGPRLPLAEDGSSTVTVSAGAVHEVYLSSCRPGARLEYSFRVQVCTALPPFSRRLHGNLVCLTPSHARFALAHVYDGRNTELNSTQS